MNKGEKSLVLLIIIAVILVTSVIVYYATTNVTKSTPESAPSVNNPESSAPQQNNIPSSGKVLAGDKLILSLGSDAYLIEVNATSTGRAAILKVNGVLTGSIGKGWTYPIDSKTNIRVDNVGLYGGIGAVDVTLIKSQ